MRIQVALDASAERHHLRGFEQSCLPPPALLVERVGVVEQLLTQHTRLVPCLSQADRMLWPQTHVPALAVEFVSEHPRPPDVAFHPEGGLQIQVPAIGKQNRRLTFLGLCVPHLHWLQAMKGPRHLGSTPVSMSRTWILPDESGCVQKRKPKKANETTTKWTSADGIGRGTAASGAASSPRNRSP